MSRLRGWWSQFRGLFARRHRDADWAAELESHIELHIADNIKAGMSPIEARRQALIKLGGVEPVKEALRSQGTIEWIESVAQDVRYACRMMRRNPGFATTAILSLALGLGSSLAVFTVADNLLLRPLPYPGASQLVMVWDANPQRGIDHNVISPGNFLDWKAQNDVFEAMAGLRESRSVLIDGDRAEEFGKQSVSAEFFDMLRIKPHRGRVFTAQEELESRSSDSLILISHRLWQNWFGGDERVIGRRVQVNSVPRTIIGVMPAGFSFRDRRIDLWEPLGLNPSENYRKTQGRWLLAFARMKDGVSREQAQGQMSAIAVRLAEAYPDFNKGWTVQVETLRDSLVRSVKASLLVLLAAVGLLLAVACANVANLLLARYISRRREIAVRASLGAARGRVIRQLLTESLILTLAGGVLGIVLARWIVRGLLLLAPEGITTVAEVQVDARIYLFAVGLSLLTGLLFGLAPGLIATRTDLTLSLRSESRTTTGSSSHIRLWLVGAEVAMTVVLLIGALLLFRSLTGLQSIQPGLDPSNVLTLRVSLPAARYDQIPKRTQFFAQAIQHLESLPGVRHASAVSHPPFSGPGAGTWVRFEGRPEAKAGEELITLVRVVMPGYFKTLGIPLKRGRDFSAADNDAAGPLRFIVNEAFARKYLQGEDPLGKHISVLMDSQNPFGEIVGVAGDVKEVSVEKDPAPTAYYPHARLGFSSMLLVVKTDGHPSGLAGAARQVVRDLDSVQPVSEVRALDEILNEDFSRQRFSAFLLSVFSAAALIVAAIGIYGIVGHTVSERTREIGLRVALGAEPRRIAGLVIGSGARVIAAGVLAGVCGSLAVTGLLRNLLYGVGPRDPLTFGAVTVLITVIALASTCVPTRRALRLAPMDALRTD